MKQSCGAHSALQPTRLAVLLSSCLLAGCGCGGGSAVPDIAKTVQDTQKSVTQAVQDTAGKATGLATGNVKLDVGGELKIDRCFARFTPPGNQRPGVLQVMTYEKPNPLPREEGFPSVFLWADVQAASAAELAGKTIPAQLFVQRDQNSHLFASSLAQPVQVKIAHVDAWSVTCELQTAELDRADGDDSVQASGKLVGLWK